MSIHRAVYVNSLTTIYPDSGLFSSLGVAPFTYSRSRHERHTLLL
jgi:hypothetical protein